MPKAQVIKSTGKWLYIRDSNNVILPARIRGKMKLLGLKHTNPVAVGDWVSFSTNEQNEASIEEVLDRKNYVIRKATRASSQTQIIAANIDLACLIFSIKRPETPLGFIDRFLITTQAFDIPTLMVLNKSDLYDDTDEERIAQLRAVYEKIGYTILRVSTKTGEGLPDLKDRLQNKTSLFSGQSGVGKSSLANALNPELFLDTGKVSDSYHKGMHTTTFAEMHPWPFGGDLIDTPGIKEFGLTGIEKDEVQDYFPEILKHKNECKFHNCLHINEPACRIKELIEDGEIAESRYQNYLRFVEECA